MTDRTRNVVVGITALAGLAGVAVMVTLFGYVPEVIEGGYVVQVHLPNAEGLTAGSRVKLSGIDIGRVSHVQLQPPPRTGVVVTLKIKDDVYIPRDASLRADPPLLGGNPTLIIDIKDLTDEQLQNFLATDNSAVIEGKATSMVGQFARELGEALSGPSQRLGELADRFDVLSKEWTLVGQNVNHLIEPRTPADVDTGGAVGNLSSVLARADTRLKDLQSLLDGMNQWVNDKDLRDSVKATVANAETLTKKLNTSVDKLDTVVEGAGRNVDQLTRRYVAVADDLSAAIGAMHKTIDTAREGDGTVAKLLNDPALYNNLNDATIRLNAALVEFKLTLEKLQKEGLPIKF